MIRRHPGTLALVCVLAMVTAGWAPTRAQPADLGAAPGDNFDCGTLALYNLLRLEGRSADLAALDSLLPPMPPAGYSMKELCNAARACGLDLSGFLLKDPSRELDRPMIAFLKPGHYVVVRPVGQSGKLVQVLNGVEDSTVLDKQAVFESPAWTGLVLVPRRTTTRDRLVVFLAGLSILSFLLWFIPKLRNLPPKNVSRLFWPLRSGVTR